MVLDRFRVDGAVAIVTGAGGGIGRAISLALAEAGASIAVADVIVDAGEQTAEMVRAAGSKAIFARVDLTKGETIATLEFHSGVEEIFDVQVVPDTRCLTLGGSPGSGDEIWLLP